MSHQTVAAQITQITRLPDHLRAMPATRREQKIRRSLDGLRLVAFGGIILVGTMGFDGYLIITRPEVPLALLLGVILCGGVIAVGLMVWGALISDPETNGPALRGTLAFFASLLRLRRIAKEGK